MSYKNAYHPKSRSNPNVNGHVEWTETWWCVHTLEYPTAGKITSNTLDAIVGHHVE